MAPAGYVPPSPAQDQNSTHDFHKEAPPPEADTNGLAYLIFFSYLGLAVSLTAFIVLKIFKSYSTLSKSTTEQLPPRKHVRLFAALAVSSVIAVWYYEIRYFTFSYENWLMWRSYYQLPPEKNHWGLWLKETSLFKEAWETAVVGNPRYWWTSQIFFFACGLGLSLEQRGLRHGIKQTWAFMLLGQVCSVSFATNLYLLSLLLSPPQPPPSSTFGIYRRKYLGPWILCLLMIVFTEVPAHLLASEHYWHHETDFLPMVVTPHIALMTLPIARALLPNKLFVDSKVEFAGTVYSYLWGATIFGAGLLFAKMTAITFHHSGFRGIINALLEHPAVSSVGFDVIFCWISWIAWWSIHTRTVKDVWDNEKDDDNKDGLEDAVSIDNFSRRENTEVRRR